MASFNGDVLNIVIKLICFHYTVFTDTLCNKHSVGGRKTATGEGLVVPIAAMGTK